MCTVVPHDGFCMRSILTSPTRWRSLMAQQPSPNSWVGCSARGTVGRLGIESGPCRCVTRDEATWRWAAWFCHGVSAIVAFGNCHAWCQIERWLSVTSTKARAWHKLAWSLSHVSPYDAQFYTLERNVVTIHIELCPFLYSIRDWL